jgi:aminopeptidase N
MCASLRVARQYVSITVDPETLGVSGFTEIEFAPTNRPPPQAVFLNARQMQINSVSLDGSSVAHKFIRSRDALAVRSGRFIRDASHFASICRVVLESPDLVIAVRQPPPFVVKIDFTVDDDSSAIVRDCGVVFTDNWADGPASWFPCIDSRAHRFSASLSVTCAVGLVAIGPGNAALTRSSGDSVTMTFRIPFPVTASAIGFAVGPFSLIPESSGLSLYSLDSSETFQNTMKPLTEIINAVVAFLEYEDGTMLTSFRFVALPFLTEIKHFPGVCFLPPSMMLPIGNVNIIPVVIPLMF